MPYSTKEDLQKLIPEQELINLTNDFVPASEADEDRINSAIMYADELINSYLRNKYALPLKYIPAIIVNLSADIAAYRLYSRRPRKLPEHIDFAYQEAKKVLENLQKEKILLDLPSEHPNETVTSSAKMITTNKTASSRIFNDGIWDTYK